MKRNPAHTIDGGPGAWGRRPDHAGAGAADRGHAAGGGPDDALVPPGEGGDEHADGLNWQAFGGAPRSSTNGNPPGSNGRAPAAGSQTLPDSILPASTNQFTGLLTVSGLAAQSASNLNAGQSFASNATAINWPRQTVDGKVVAILRSAQIGAPYFAQQVSFFFGAVIPPPSTGRVRRAAAAGGEMFRIGFRGRTRPTATRTSRIISAPTRRRCSPRNPGRLTLCGKGPRPPTESRPTRRITRPAADFTIGSTSSITWSRARR